MYNELLQPFLVEYKILDKGEFFITREKILNIANLSKIYLNETEIDNAITEMGGIINFVNQINNSDTPSSELENSNILSNVLREDEVIKATPRNDILKNADGGKDGFFYIKKQQC